MEFIKPLWPHQERAFNEAIRLYEENEKEGRTQTGYALFFEPRCGKTATAINILRYLCAQRKSRLRTLIFCPPRVMSTWKAEILIHSKFAPAEIVLLTGSAERRAKELASTGGSILITNYESLLMPRLFERFESWDPEFLIFDESHRLKDSRAKRSILAALLAERANYRLILTGSPVLNSPADLYQQFKILDGGETFSYHDYRTNKLEPLSFKGFMNTYFVDQNLGMARHKHFPKWELRPGAMEEISTKIAKKSMRITRAECLSLPPNEEITLRVEMSPEQEKLYLEMRRDFITWYKESPVVASLAITKTIRLLQITSGFVKTEDGKEEHLVTIPKQRALQDLLEDLLPTGKALVWCVFKENYRQVREVCEALKVRYVEVHGLINASEAEKNIESFQKDEGVRVFIGHPESGGEGINLVQAPYNIFYSRNHSLKHSLQASARNQSQDSTHLKTTRYDIVARGTIDELVAEVVKQKEKMANAAYADLILKNLLQVDCS